MVDGEDLLREMFLIKDEHYHANIYIIRKPYFFSSKNI